MNVNIGKTKIFQKKLSTTSILKGHQRSHKVTFYHKINFFLYFCLFEI